MTFGKQLRRLLKFMRKFTVFNGGNRWKMDKFIELYAVDEVAEALNLHPYTGCRLIGEFI